MNRGKIHVFVIALLATAALATGACSAGDAKAREQTTSPPVVQIAAVAADRAADRALHPRHRHADGRGTGRGRRGNRRPRGRRPSSAARRSRRATS